MENENMGQTEEKKDSRIRRGKEKDYRLIVHILSVALIACVLFSGFQSLYIFRMNNGLEGIFSYTRIADRYADNNDDDTGELEGKTLELASKVLPEPWFSLEEAAVIAGSDKKRMSTVEIVNAVSPATVSVSVISVDDGKESKLSSGTGFIITADGYIVTNRHVVDLADEAVSTYYVTVNLPGEKKPVRVKTIGSDAQTDIAVLKVDTDKSLPCVTLGDSDTIQAGELAIAIGNAMGSLDDTVTVGVISATGREIVRNGYYVETIQTDAAINPGNSGGPLINSFGEVIGITNAKMLSSTSENLGFAIPINSVKTVIESIINYGKVINRAYLGVSVRYVADDSYYGATGGTYVGELVKDGPADKAGFEIGDRILMMDGVEITDSGDIIKVRDSHRVGDQIDFVIERDGKEITLTLIIGDSADY